MNKKEFMSLLEKELKRINVSDIEEIMEYYDEYIEDQKENGKKEKDIIKKFDMDELLKEAKIQKQINTASKKPTISNGLKALIAFLGVLSFPMLIVVGSILFAIVVTIFALIFSFIVTVASVIFGSGVGIAIFIGYLISGKISISAFLFAIGVSLVLFGLFIFLLKWALYISREIITWLAQFLQEKLYKRRGGIKNE